MISIQLWWALLAAETDAPAESARADSPVLWWVAGVIVAVVFAGIVWRTLRRNRLRK